MGQTIIMLFLYADICIIALYYLFLRKVRKRVGFHLGMNISVVMGGMSALLSGVLLISQYPFHFTLITIISTLIGLLVGGLFGVLFDYQTFVTGCTNGIVVGLMAPMIGAVIEMPSLFIVFLHGILIVCIITISISIQRS